MIKNILLFCVVLTNFLFTQTYNDYFPLQNGNYWEYWSSAFPSTKEGQKVLGDTLMSNGKTYKIISQKYSDDNYYRYYFVRGENSLLYFYSKDSISCSSREYIKYDFSKPDSTIWPVCGFPQNTHRGCASTKTEYSYVLKQNVEAKTFFPVKVQGNDTIWWPLNAEGYVKMEKGLGKTLQFAEGLGFYELTGAIINGISYGTILSTKEEYIQSRTYSLSQNYPNPFNPSTTISYQLPISGNVTIKIYDVLGNEVKTLVNETKPAGAYSVMFDGSKLSSGVYFYTIRANNFVQTKKMVLMK